MVEIDDAAADADAEGDLEPVEAGRGEVGAVEAEWPATTRQPPRPQ
ncbi:hypothetical protein QRX50_20005 [Amycolatopsis carbonis]|uniref:Uncharacterized protein n=1 Tax=Amycolatopsis carbonis TaxID=715471 RepID=A0A9Y2IPG4_9PSEU|nr:hypothetical protein [Amycolatopsis sp. 2-15]WIX82890.1 hypothetical protein QRX50_20005 [Amycolatopsis sp. 2-15]